MERITAIVGKDIRNQTYHQITECVCHQNLQSIYKNTQLHCNVYYSEQKCMFPLLPRYDIAANQLLRTRLTFSKSLIISVAVSKLGCSGLVFVDPGTKTDSSYYRDELLLFLRHCRYRSLASLR